MYYFDVETNTAIVGPMFTLTLRLGKNRLFSAPMIQLTCKLGDMI